MIYYIGEQRLFTSTEFSTATIEECIDYFKDKKEIAVDTETTGLDPHSNKLLCIQFGTNEHQYVINCSLYPLKYIKKIFDNDVLFLFQNAKFDLKFLMKEGIYPKKIYDTFLVELILTTGMDRKQLKVALDDLVWKYCTVKLDKSIRGNINREGLSDRVIKYAAEDVKWLSEVKKNQLEKIEEWQLMSILDLENEVTKVFAKMEYDGINLNTTKWSEVSTLTTSKVKELEKELDDIVLNDKKLNKFVPNAVQGNLFGFAERNLHINWGSSQQKKDILLSLGIKEDSTGDRILQRNKNKHILIPKLIEYNKYKKLSDAFGSEFLKNVNPITNRLHMNIWPILATGRIAVSFPNLNQIPNPEKSEIGKIIRSCFIPKEGYKMVGGDYSGMELRILAEFSQDPMWVDSFNQDIDLHSTLAALTFDIDASKVRDIFPLNPSAGSYRSIQKMVNFGLSYGMSEFKLADTIQVSIEKAKGIITKFFSVVPVLQKFLNKLGKLGKDRGYIRTSTYYNRVRWFPQWHACQDKHFTDRYKLLGEIERASMNTPIQGCNANIIKLALINVQKEIDENNWPVNILLSVYDEIQTECREDKADEWCLKLEEIMINSAKEVIKTVPIKVDCGVHNYWEK